MSGLIDTAKGAWDAVSGQGARDAAEQARLDIASAGAEAKAGYTKAIEGYTSAIDAYGATGKDITAGYTKTATAAVDAYGHSVNKAYAPYMALGEQSTAALRKLFSSPEGLTSDPFYQARKKESLDAVQNSAAAKGSLFGGNTLLELIKKGGEFASAEFDKATSRYATGAEIGLQASAGYESGKRAEASARYDIAKGTAGLETGFAGASAEMQANLAEMEIGKGLAGSRMFENQASFDATRYKSNFDFFSSWFSGSGPFGQSVDQKIFG